MDRRLYNRLKKLPEASWYPYIVGSITATLGEPGLSAEDKLAEIEQAIDALETVEKEAED